MYSVQWHFKKIGNTDRISLWKSKELLDEIIKLLSPSNNNLAPSLNYFGTKTRTTFDERF